ncbi:hypothetical protein QQF64_022072 [Cirrhinus molitorella]|uniref:Uncharacterized protein n=1 Tax=Cirrhinus molitorella TaxID=172907 RepID=A0ABR3LAN1_9TELE
MGRSGLVASRRSQCRHGGARWQRVSFCRSLTGALHTNCPVSWTPRHCCTSSTAALSLSSGKVVEVTGSYLQEYCGTLFGK